jgi:hypothetical protein
MFVPLIPLIRGIVPAFFEVEYVVSVAIYEMKIPSSGIAILSEERRQSPQGRERTKGIAADRTVEVGLSSQSMLSPFSFDDLTLALERRRFGDPPAMLFGGS